MDALRIENDLRAFLADTYPNIEIRVEPWSEDMSRTAVYFVEEKFASLYPMQRYHYLTHLIPPDYQEHNLAEAMWFELAPGEEPTHLVYPDEELISEITEDVINCLIRDGFFQTLDDVLCPRGLNTRGDECSGDFLMSKGVLAALGYKDADYFDIFHVLMARGAYCDCEILYNVAEDSRLRSRYWTDAGNRKLHV